MFLCAILEGLRFIVVNRSIFGISSIDTGLSTTRLTQPLESLARENNAFNAFTSGVLEPPYEDDHRKSVETGFHAQQKGEKEDSLNLQRSKIQTDLSFSFCSENCHCRDSIAIVLVSRLCATNLPCTSPYADIPAAYAPTHLPLLMRPRKNINRAAMTQYTF